MQTQVSRPSGSYLLLLAFTGACLGAGLMEMWRAVSLLPHGGWLLHAMVATFMLFAAAYLWVLARDRAVAAANPDLPEPVDPNTRDSRAYSR